MNIEEMSLAELDELIYKLGMDTIIALIANSHTKEELQEQFYGPRSRAIDLYNKREALLEGEPYD